MDSGSRQSLLPPAGSALQSLGHDGVVGMSEVGDVVANSEVTVRVLMEYKALIYELPREHTGFTLRRTDWRRSRRRSRSHETTPRSPLKCRETSKNKRGVLRL